LGEVRFIEMEGRYRAMNEDFLDILSRSTPAEARERLGLPARELDAQVLQRTTTVDGESDSPEREAIFAYTAARWSESTLEARRAAQPLNPMPELEELLGWARRHYGLTQGITPEILEWARREFDKYGEEELLAEFREIQATGGLELKDFIHELEREAAP
jgi:hypothetical protein